MKGLCVLGVSTSPTYLTHADVDGVIVKSEAIGEPETATWTFTEVPCEEYLAENYFLQGAK